MDRLSDQELSAWNEPRFFGGVHINAKVLQNITSELIAARAELKRLRANRFASFDGADWFWRIMDPDDSADTPTECINRSCVGLFAVCEIASSYQGPTRFGFNAPVLDPESDDEEFMHFETQEEAIAAANVRLEALKQKGGV